MKKILFYSAFSVFLSTFFFSCKHRDQANEPDLKTIKYFHNFSENESKDLFMLQFKNSEKPFCKMHFKIYSSKDELIYDYEWNSKNFVTIADKTNYYLDEKARIRKFDKIVDDIFSERNFSLLESQKITGLLTSSDEIYMKDVLSDTTTIAFSFFFDDMCLAYSKKHKKTFMFHALSKNLLKKYKL